jgi:chromosome partitioning protein
MIVTVGGIKGGSGKSTVTSNLVVMRALLGKRVLLVDTDSQMTSTNWVEQRRSYNIDVNWTTIQLTNKDLYVEVRKLSKNYDDVVIDAGGRETYPQRSALSVSDKFVIPFNPRSFDVWTLDLVEKLYIEMKASNQKLEAFSFINKSDTKGSDNEDAKNILLNSPNIKFLDCNIGLRKAFSNACAQGLGVIELKGADKKALQEIQYLHDLIYC